MARRKKQKLERKALKNNSLPKVCLNIVVDERVIVEPLFNVFDKSPKIPFSWVFVENEMRLNGSFAFLDYKLDSCKFIKDMNSKITKLYDGMSWENMIAKGHCGNFKSLNKKQIKVAKPPHLPTGKKLAHFHITQKHVLFGFRDEHYIFHITINDPEHKFDKL